MCFFPEIKTFQVACFCNLREWHSLPAFKIFHKHKYSHCWLKMLSTCCHTIKTPHFITTTWKKEKLSLISMRTIDQEDSYCSLSMTNILHVHLCCISNLFKSMGNCLCIFCLRCKSATLMKGCLWWISC